MSFSFKDLDYYISQATNVPISCIKSEENFFNRQKILVKKVCHTIKRCDCGVLLEPSETRFRCPICDEYYTNSELANESYEISQKTLRTLLCTKIGTDKAPKEMDVCLGLWRVGSYKKISVYITDTLKQEHIDKIKTQPRKVIFATSSSISNFDYGYLLPIGSISVENGEISLGCIDEYISGLEEELKPTKPEINRKDIMEFIRKYYYGIFYDCAKNKKEIPKITKIMLHNVLIENGFKCSMRTLHSILKELKGKPKTMIDDPFYLVYGIISERNDDALQKIAFPKKEMKLVFDSIIYNDSTLIQMRKKIKKDMQLNGFRDDDIDKLIAIDAKQNW